jgi:predicted permease
VTAFLTVLQVVAPVAALAALGFLWVRSGHDWPMDFVGRLAMGVATPALIFTALARAEVAPQAMASVALGAGLGYLVLLGLFMGLVRVLGLDARALAVPLAFGNTGNLGLPLALFAFGETGLALAVVVFAVSLTLQFSLGLWLMSGASPGRLLREPSLWASLAGALFLWQGWQLPGWIDTTLGLAGQMAIPLMLLMLGVALAGLHPARLPLAGGLALIRLGLCLAVGLGIAWAFAPDRLAFAVIVLQFATPVPVTAYLMVARLGGDGEAVAGLVLASTLLAVLSLPLALALLM